MKFINQLKQINLIIYSLSILIFLYFSFLAPSVLTEFLLNDNNTAVYSVYARNILEYPFSKTYLLMSEIGPDGQNILITIIMKIKYKDILITLFTCMDNCIFL